MGFHDPHSGAAATVFLVLYVLFTIGSTYAVYRRGIKSRYFMIFFFGLLRVGAQTSAVGFSIVGYDGVGWLVAYLVLGAEGYFTLILCSFYFLCTAEVEVTGKSFWHPTEEQIEEQSRGSKLQARLIRMNTPIAIFHWILIPANAMIIAGGTQMTGATPQDSDYQERMDRSKIMRGVGQGVFLAQNAFLGGVVLWMLFKQHIRVYKAWAVLGAWPFLFIRGVFGLLSVFIQPLNYFDLSNYTSTGLSARFIACEYVLGATMEFLGASILLSTFYFDKSADATPGPQVLNDDEEKSVQEVATNSIPPSKE